MRSFILCITLIVVLERTAFADTATVCALLDSRGQHIGETISFRGEYLTDHTERSLIIPLGCPHGVGIGAIDWEVSQSLDELDYQRGQGQRVEADFTGVIVQVAPNGQTFFQDDGVRFNVTSVSGAVVADAPTQLRHVTIPPPDNH